MITKAIVIFILAIGSFGEVKELYQLIFYIFPTVTSFIKFKTHQMFSIWSYSEFTAIEVDIKISKMKVSVLLTLFLALFVAYV